LSESIEKNRQGAETPRGLRKSVGIVRTSWRPGVLAALWVLPVVLALGCASPEGQDVELRARVPAPPATPSAVAPVAEAAPVDTAESSVIGSVVQVPDAEAAETGRRLVPNAGPLDRLVAADLEGGAPLHSYHRVQLGSVEVLSRDDLGPVSTESAGENPQVCLVVLNAPAEGVLALLERVTGRHLDHGAAPITFQPRIVKALDAQRACALASRAHARHALRDLPETCMRKSGCECVLGLQATLKTSDKRFALVNGRAVAEGEEVLPGLKLVHVYLFGLELDDQGKKVMFGKGRGAFWD
jgi:hypothetical protein